MTHWRLRVGGTGESGWTAGEGGSPVPTWRQGMTPLTWKQFGNAPSTVDPEQNVLLNPNHPAAAPWRGTGDGTSAVEAWNSATNHINLGCVRIGPAYGHGDGGSNAIFRLNYLEDDPEWFLERNPSGCIGNLGTLDDGAEASNVYTFDGAWRARHNYNLVHARGDNLILLGAGASYSSGGSGTGANPCIFEFNGTTVTHLAQGATAPGGVNGNSPKTGWYDELRDRGYVCSLNSGNIEYWDFGTSLKGATSTNTNFPDECMAIRIPEYDIAVLLHNNYSGHVGIFNYERGGATVKTPGASGTPPGWAGYSGGSSTGHHNGDWVPGYNGGTGAVICWHGGASVKVLTPNVSDSELDQWAWTDLAAAGSNAVDPGNPTVNGVNHRWFYVPDLRGFILIKSFITAPYFFALE